MKRIELEEGDYPRWSPDRQLGNEMDDLVLFPKIGNSWCQVKGIKLYYLKLDSWNELNPDGGDRWADQARGMALRNLALGDEDWWLDIDGYSPFRTADNKEYIPLHLTLSTFAQEDEYPNAVECTSLIHDEQRHFLRFSRDAVETVVKSFWRDANPGPWIEGYCVPRANTQEFLDLPKLPSDSQAKELYRLCKLVLVSYPSEHSNFLLTTTAYDLATVQQLLNVESLRRSAGLV